MTDVEALHCGGFAYAELGQVWKEATLSVLWSAHRILALRGARGGVWPQRGSGVRASTLGCAGHPTHGEEMEKLNLGITGDTIPALGLGTFGIGGKFKPDGSSLIENIAIIKKAIEMGYTLIDTAESYCGGQSEVIVGEVIKDFPRDDLFIVSKISPENCKFLKVIKSAKQSVARLGTHMDMCLVHMPPKNSISETIIAMEKLIDMGLTRHIGISNFNERQTIEAAYAVKKYTIAVNQSEMSLDAQNLSVLDTCRNLGISFMAYRPLGNGDLLKNPKFSEVKKMGKKYKKTGVQTALRWVMDMDIPTLVNSTNETHLKENLGALDWNLGDDWDTLAAEFR